ncbi:MAG: hypothetical protein ABR598_04590 [Candidatus Dormibacteria bacterium]
MSRAEFETQTSLTPDKVAALALGGSLLLAVVMVATLTPAALAHNERPAPNPPNNDATPVPAQRAIDPAGANLLVVCKPNSPDIFNAWPSGWDYLKAIDAQLMSRCQYHDLQAAVDAVPHSGTTIAILPGTYLESPSTDTTTWSQHCKDLLAAVITAPNISYAHQLACPHVTQEVAILGDPDSVQKGLTDGDGKYDCDGRLCNLQVEGMGRDPGQQVLAANRAPTGWSLGWVHPPAGAAVTRPILLQYLPVIGDMPNTARGLPAYILAALVLVAAGIRIGRAWRRYPR